MEVKLSQRRDLLLPKLLPNPNFPSHTHRVLSFYLNSWANSKSSFHKHFRYIAQKWRLRIQEMSKVQHPTKHYLVHVVKEGETLTSISKQYSVSISAIAAANRSIVDIDLVFKGQHLNIPSASGDTQMAKTTGYFLVLVPLIAFCVRCIISALHTRVAGKFRHQVVNESEGRRHGCRSMRWKSALSEILEPDTLDAVSSSHSNSLSEDQSQVSFEEEPRAYDKLEQDYQKFLSECGMSEWGHWRGGSPE
ncbi:hypothetical protein RGQ29_003409 [Quercus rubra]|uniref:LysM domain-containing protein n=1 Tax=Quercus rubra TaxID=3512 RepID=A0AAN7IE67_QUERU|nr:hypothetical protein RGQ29_003409 [Quercus rubra]